MDKIKIKRETLSNYQLKIAELYNMPFGNVKKYASLWKLATPSDYDWSYNNTSCISNQLISMAKEIYSIQHIQKNRNKKEGTKGGKTLYKLMSNAVYGKTMETLRIKINNQEKRLFKMDIQTKLYVTQNIRQWFIRDT